MRARSLIRVLLASISTVQAFPAAVPAAAPASATASPASSTRVPGQAFPDSSLYQLTSSWATDDGKALRLGDLAGKRRILSLFFGHCESSCPMALGRLKGLAASLPPGWEERAGIVLITLDPSRDGGAALRDFRKRMELSRAGWTLLRGGPEDTRELAMLLGVAYRPSPSNGGIEHNSVIVLLDERGVMVRKYEGADPGPAFLEDLRKAISKSP